MRRTLLPAVAAAALFLVSDARGDQAQQRWIEWHRVRALSLEAEGRKAEAVEEWTVLAHLQPGDARAAARAALAMVEMIAEPPLQPRRNEQPYRHAEDLIRLALQRGGMRDPMLAYAIGRLRFADGDFELAEEMLGFARRRGFDPARARLWHYRAVVNDSKRLLDGQFADEAVRRLDILLRDMPDHPEALAARINLALAWRLRGEHALASKALREAIAEHPWAARAHLALGQVYADQSRFEEAAVSLQEAMDRSLERDDPVYAGRRVYQEALLSFAILERRRNDLDAGEKYARQLLAIEPDSPDALYALGAVLKLRGDEKNLAEAARHLRRAVRLVPGKREYLQRLVETLREMGEDDEAKSWQTKLDELQEQERREQREGFKPSR